MRVFIVQLFVLYFLEPRLPIGAFIFVNIEAYLCYLVIVLKVICIYSKCLALTVPFSVVVLLENIRELLYLRFPVVTTNLARNGEKNWFITKDRVIDANLKKQIEKKTLYVANIMNSI